MVLKFFYREPRPFWYSSDIHLSNSTCDNIKFDYAMPSFMLFNLQFMWVYSNYNYRYKYSLENNRCISYLLSIFYFYNMVSTQLYLIFFGWIYIY